MFTLTLQIAPAPELAGAVAGLVGWLILVGPALLARARRAKE